MMYLIHTVPHINEEASGPSYSVPRLCQSVGAGGNSVELNCLSAGVAIKGIKVVAYSQWPVFSKFAISPGFVYSLYRKSETADVVHNHSLWSMVNVAVGLVVPNGKAKLVVSPRGTLSTWALNRSKYIKRLLWPFQRRLLFKADLLHATCEQEYQEIRALGLKTPVAIIPNGIDLPDSRFIELTSQKESRTLLFLSRIHPKKGIDHLLQSWSKLQLHFPEWRLIIVGKGEARHVAEANKLAERLQLKRVDFSGPLYGKAKEQAYLRADLFVLPTHSENFGLVVAEALAHGCPAVVSHGAPWSGLEEKGCGWWIDNSIESLTIALKKAMQLQSQDLRKMGMLGREWMASEYSWDSVGKMMVAAYKWILGDGPIPRWVRLQ